MTEKRLHIQVQLQREPRLDETLVMALLLAIGTEAGINRVGFTDGEDKGRWIGFNYWTDTLGQAWPLIREKGLGDPSIGALLAKATIVVCEGDDGWNDYLLLHHFDPDEPLDRL